MPNINGFRKLLSSLGFQDLCLPQSLLFIYDVLQFLRYQNASNERIISPAPLELAISFLEDHERGYLYWAGSESSDDYLDLYERQRCDYQHLTKANIY